ncbi:MAG: hypothetical protein ABUL42_04360 [Terricaulis silvestris]
MSQWFVDKLGPQPNNPAPLTGSSLPKVNSADSLTPAQRGAPAPQAQRPAPQPMAQAKPAPQPAPKAPPPPEPEPKKKKGWF